ncbi:hypothetical protein D9M68_582600 [compost metagenome]
MQRADRGWLQFEPTGLAQEGFGLAGAEAQLRGLDLEQLAARAQPAQAALRHPARADHDTAARRQAFDHLPHQAADGNVLDRFEIVEEQREGAAVAGEPVDQRQRLLAGVLHQPRAGRLGRGAERLCDGGLDRAQEAGGIVVGAVKGEPGGAPAGGFQARAALEHGGGLAKARGRAHQHELDEVRGAHGVADRRALDLERRQQRWTQLGGQRSGASAGGRRHALSGLLDTCHWRFVVFRAAPPLRQCEGQCEGQCEAMRPPAQQRGRA